MQEPRKNNSLCTWHGGGDIGRRDIYLGWRESKKIEMGRCRQCEDFELSPGQSILFEGRENEFQMIGHFLQVVTQILFNVLLKKMPVSF